MPGFRDIVGHGQIIEHFQNAIKMDKISHAYILAGEKGSGKRTIATAFAQTLQCEQGQTDACGICHACKQAESRNHPDIIYVTHEKPNSIGVEEIREQLVGDVLIKPYSSKYKVYIVNDADKMTVQAQNALLKTIEEPPSYAVILLLAGNVSSMLPTILSRCVTLSMKPVPDEEVKKYLMEHVQVPDYQADVCVAFAQGNIGKAVQLASSDSFNEIRAAALHLLKNVRKMDMSDIMSHMKGISEFKLEVQDFLDFLAVWYRDVLYFKATKDIDGLIFKDQAQSISDQANISSYEGIEEILKALQKAKTRLNANVNFELVIGLLFLLIKEN
ncbi:DNA polymerase III subunit delta' [Murimonas intestini]|uniref:DNA polymerase III subunit delta' n=1 Tax=Murimonas intestini TaxID=1337051 RepID=A0AB73T0Y7_9FIRM|nr:DNA polymerase III subunit delta' [Murimonas intestini]MCR1840106.1 DNA polymerase III subunit delta' [Murimonas intestini]MCR1867558.1 DNA polymerase III subunit delta' [Murimonas intestini]MCR1885027.1 DNA polymerase III subunit delta' [Murimonas intestini]